VEDIPGRAPIGTILARENLLHCDDITMINLSGISGKEVKNGVVL